jgi:hypothetical protein
MMQRKRATMATEVAMDDYLPSDHQFTQFLAEMTPKKAFKDRTAMFTTPEKQLDRFFRQAI